MGGNGTERDVRDGRYGTRCVGFGGTERDVGDWRCVTRCEKLEVQDEMKRDWNNGTRLCLGRCERRCPPLSGCVPPPISGCGPPLIWLRTSGAQPIKISQPTTGHNVIQANSLNPTADCGTNP